MIAQNPYNPNGPTDHNAWSTSPSNQPVQSKTETPATSTTPAAATTAKEEAITDLYMEDGDDYYIDDTAFSDAQIGTGDNETAASVVGSGSSGGSSETNSNVNTGVFGGSSKAAHPGYSLW